MLKIRLQRVARKHIPIFRVVVTDSRNSTKSGKSIEVLGTYNLVSGEKKVDAERIKHWISKGAKPSGTLHNFLVGERIIEGKKINVLPRRRPIKKEAKAEEKKMAETESPPAEAAAAKETTPAETPVKVE